MKIRKLFPLWKPAGLCLLFAAVFFFWSYGLANRHAASLEFVPSVSYSWEQYIPFIPWTIIPYWSMDLLYGISFFLCISSRELKIHTIRLVMTSVFCCSCFMFFPLTFSVSVPPVSNQFLALLFFCLSLVDATFNQAPSLHIALAWLVWLRFAAHTKGVLKTVLAVWFFLIGVSVLTCYQHHFIDVPLGLLAGVWISYLFPMQSYARTIPVAQPKRWKLACLYGIGGCLCAYLAMAIKEIALLLLWPGMSLLIVALGYSLWGTAVFQKDTQGCQSISARVLLAPYLLGAYLSQRWFMRKIPACSVITEGISIGSLPLGRPINQDCLLDMTAEFDSSHLICRYKIVCPYLDLTVLSVSQIQKSVEALNQLVQQGSVLVCCALGLSRSAAVVAAYLVWSRQAKSIQEAVCLLKEKRPAIVLPLLQEKYLRQWEQNCIIN